MEAAAIPTLSRRRRHAGRLRTASDERLVARIREGDERAFEALYDRHHRGILAFCRHMVGSHQEAEDAVQHTFAAAYRALQRDDRDLAVKAWLYAIARNRCVSVLRARRDETPIDEVQPAVEGLAAEVQRREDLQELLRDLARLPDAQRAALVLAQLGAHSHEEIGVILGVRTEKVKALVFQARETLIGYRHAREMDCREIREQLSVLRGGARRRANVRRHLEQCPGCRAFRVEVDRQKAALSVLLPVVPTVALKQSVIGAALGAGAGAGGLAAGGGGAGMLSALGAKSLATKAVVAFGVVGAAGGGGYETVQQIEHQPGPVVAATPAQAAPRAPAQPVPKLYATVSSVAAPRSYGQPAGEHEKHARGAPAWPAPGTDRPPAHSGPMSGPQPGRLAPPINQMPPAPTKPVQDLGPTQHAPAPTPTQQVPSPPPPDPAQQTVPAGTGAAPQAPGQPGSNTGTSGAPGSGTSEPTIVPPLPVLPQPAGPTTTPTGTTTTPTGTTTTPTTPTGTSTTPTTPTGTSTTPTTPTGTTTTPTTPTGTTTTPTTPTGTSTTPTGTTTTPTGTTTTPNGARPSAKTSTSTGSTTAAPSSAAAPRSR